MFDRPEFGNQALLVHVELTGQAHGHSAPVTDIDAQRTEFRELAESAGLQVHACIQARRKRPDSRTYIGRGKLEELRAELEAHPVDVVLFGQRLSPSQERNLEQELSVRVLDRSSLILDIFAQRARSFEGKLQVELAQLSHLSTRLVRGWTHLERQKGGIGLRGPGETQLETDRRLLGDRVKMLKRRLERVRTQREQGRGQRGKSGIASVALVGYTNAGKSTLFNRLAGQSVYAADQLFATLDPTLRRIELPGSAPVVLADTVGFISELPHELVQAFRSTLTETREADLLLHVVDHSDSERDVHMADVHEVLDSIGAGEVPMLTVFNKTDRSGHAQQVERSVSGEIQALWLSAMSGDGVEALTGAIGERLSRQRVCGWAHLQPDQGQVRARLYALDSVREEKIESDGGQWLFIDLDATEFARMAHEYRISIDHDRIELPALAGGMH